LINEIPLLIESIAIPVVLLKLSYEMKPNRPAKGAIKWGLITGTVFVFVLWLNNSSLWVLTIMRQGTKYLTNYPENLLSFAITSIGLLVLVFITAFFAKKHMGTTAVQNLNFRVIGAITITVGLIYLWNYLTWIFFGRAEIWSNWYAWFLGHNLNLWLLSLPMIGLPLLFSKETPNHALNPADSTLFCS
jgi:hypothetical protein